MKRQVVHKAKTVADEFEDVKQYEKQLEELKETLLCPHGINISKCDACYIASDLAFDANREKRL